MFGVLTPKHGVLKGLGAIDTASKTPAAWEDAGLLDSVGVRVAAVPGEVDCGTRKPGVRCRSNPCDAATCPGVPGAACVPFFCQDPIWFRGHTVTQPPCTAVFVDPSFGDVVDCSTAAKPLLPRHVSARGSSSGSGSSGGSSVQQPFKHNLAGGQAAASLQSRVSGTCPPRIHTEKSGVECMRGHGIGAERPSCLM